MTVNNTIKEAVRVEDSQSFEIAPYTALFIFGLILIILSSGITAVRLENYFLELNNQRLTKTYNIKSKDSYSINFIDKESACNYLQEKYESFDGYDCRAEKLAVYGVEIN